MTADRDDTALLSAVKNCAICSDLPNGPRPILHWQRQAPILIAGQAPGRITHEKGIPFDDPSGDRLRHWLGVDRKEFYDSRLFAIVPMAFCYPGTGKSGDLPPPAICARIWRAQLLERMQATRLTIIIGKYAASWHFPDRKGTLTDLILCWKETLPGTVVLPHPSPRNRMWLSRNHWFEDDLLPKVRARVAAILGENQPSPDDRL